MALLQQAKHGGSGLQNGHANGFANGYSEHTLDMEVR